MPGFIKTPKDEAKWKKAKEAANKTLSEADGDSYWALTNSIYQKMSKSDELSSLENLKLLLQKARRTLSDEPSEEQEDPEFTEDQGFREFDPETEEDDADKWLSEHDPERRSEEESDEEPTEEDEDYHDYDPGNDEEPTEEDRGEFQGGEPREPQKEKEEEVIPAKNSAVSASKQEIPKSESRFPQPSKEEIAEMRQYTRPWEQRARDKTRLEAEASKNPVLHHEGRLVEARNTAHKSRQDAFKEFQSTPDYQNADPISQMEMDSKFNKEFHEKNPNYLSDAAKVHSEAHKKGLGAKEVHAAAKDEQIRHVLGGGAQAETPVSVEEGMQHAGGAKGEEGTTGSMTQDPSSSFATGNKDFLNQYAKDYANKAKKPKDVNDMANYDEESRADVGRILGDNPALKDPKNKAMIDVFFEKYHPLIAMNAHKVLNKLGLDHKKGDIDLGMLHEAGMHGLMQAINDYDHDHPSKASFATHAGNKIRGLQQTALRDKDVIPAELRSGAKKFGQQSQTPDKQQATLDPTPVKSTAADLLSKFPNLADRHKRIETARKVVPPKPKMPTGEGEQ